VPVGGVNVTNDLAIGLKTDPEIAEKVKLAHAVASPRGENEEISLTHDSETLTFSSTDIDEIVEARLEEIFDAVGKELKRAGRAGQLPSGVVLIGGGAKLKGIAEFAKQHLGLAARVGKPSGFAGVAEQAEDPQYAAAIGLMLADSEGQSQVASGTSGSFDGKKTLKSATGVIGKFLDKFKA
jgi:cell division protein FtsA